MAAPMEMSQDDQTNQWLCLSQDPMPIDEMNNGNKLVAHVVMSHGLSVKKNNTAPVSTVNLRASYPNVIVVMNCHPIPQKMPTRMCDLWAKLNTFDGDIKSLAELMINLNDIYFEQERAQSKAGLCYYFDRCPNIYLNPERKKWRDGIYKLPDIHFTATETHTPNFSRPVDKDINNLACFEHLESYIHYLHCRDPKNLNIVIVFACTNPVEEESGTLSYDNPKLKYCKTYPVKDTQTSIIIEAILTKWKNIQAGGGSGQTMFLLGRRRKIYNSNNKLYIRYNNELITLKKALKLNARSLETSKPDRKLSGS